MITGDYDQLNDLARRHVCAEDNGRLVVAWHKEKDCYYIKCGTCGECKGMTRVKSLTEEYRAGNLPDGPIKDNVEKGIKQRDLKTTKLPMARTMGGAPAVDLGSGELLTLDQVHALVDYAHKYGLDPYRDHVYVMYGKPYIGLDGYLYHANKEKIPYSLDSRPVSDEERKSHMIGEGDHAWIAKLTRHDTGGTFTGLGIVTKDEMTAESKKKPGQLRSPIVAAHPWQLAQKRAEWQALRRGFPIGETGEEEQEY